MPPNIKYYQKLPDYRIRLVLDEGDMVVQCTSKAQQEYLIKILEYKLAGNIE